MTAATRSRTECSISERIPKLPVAKARKALRDTSATAEPTEPSAASFFSRTPCSSEFIVRADGIIRWAEFGGALSVPYTELIEK